MWHISLDEPALRGFFVADHPFLAAEWVSKGNPGVKVRVEAYVRFRAIFLDGRMISERRNLREFYTDISDAQQWAWENGLELPQEVEA